MNINGKHFDENELSNISVKSFSSSDQNNKISDHSRYKITKEKHNIFNLLKAIMF